MACQHDKDLVILAVFAVISALSTTCPDDLIKFIRWAQGKSTGRLFVEAPRPLGHTEIRS